MEVVFAIVIFVLAAGGMALGVIFGRRPIAGSCGGIECIPGARCSDCPNRAGKEDP